MWAPAEALIPRPRFAQKLLAAETVGALIAALRGRRPMATALPAAQRRKRAPNAGLLPVPIQPPLASTWRVLFDQPNPEPPALPPRRSTSDLPYATLAVSLRQDLANCYSHSPALVTKRQNPDTSS